MSEISAKSKEHTVVELFNENFVLLFFLHPRVSRNKRAPTSSKESHLTNILPRETSAPSKCKAKYLSELVTLPRYRGLYFIKKTSISKKFGREL